MDVPPPVRRLKLPLSRAARVAVVAVLVGLLLAWTAGSAPIEEWCGVCRFLRRSTAIGLFWDDRHRLAVTIGGDDLPSPAYTDTFQAWGHVHTWEIRHAPPRRFVAGLFVERTWCPGLGHAFHTDASEWFSASPEFRRTMAARVAEGKWTVADLEDALLWCDHTGCPFDWSCLPSDVADRRANCNARLRVLAEEAKASRKAR